MLFFAKMKFVLSSPLKHLKLNFVTLIIQRGIIIDTFNMIPIDENQNILNQYTYFEKLNHI